MLAEVLDLLLVYKLWRTSQAKPTLTMLVLEELIAMRHLPGHSLLRMQEMLMKMNFGTNSLEAQLEEATLTQIKLLEMALDVRVQAPITTTTDDERMQG
jgi:hypothetical protein